MTIDEAKVIFKSWQDFMEIADKFLKIMLPIPESFLPYPKDTLIEALGIIIKDYYDSGNSRIAEIIEGTMVAHLYPSLSDKKALTEMKNMLDIIEKDPKWKKEILKSLKECQESWIKSRGKFI